MKESLKLIEAKVRSKNYDFNQIELNALSDVYFHITSTPQGGGVGRVLSKGCSSCIVSATNIVHNYLMFHAPTEIKDVEHEAKVTIVKVAEKRTRKPRQPKAKK